MNARGSAQRSDEQPGWLKRNLWWLGIVLGLVLVTVGLFTLSALISTGTSTTSVEISIISSAPFSSDQKSISFDLQVDHTDVSQSFTLVNTSNQEQRSRFILSGTSGRQEMTGSQACDRVLTDISCRFEVDGSADGVIAPGKQISVKITLNSATTQKRGDLHLRLVIF